MKILHSVLFTFLLLQIGSSQNPCYFEEIPILNVSTQTCIKESDCTSTSQTLYLYNKLCTNVRCPSTPSKNTPGYKELPKKDGVIICQKCPLELGVGGKTCSPCAEGYVLDYNDGVCKSYYSIDLIYPNKKNYAFSLDQKAFLLSFNCPQFFMIFLSSNQIPICYYCSVALDEITNRCLETLQNCKRAYYDIKEKVCTDNCYKKSVISESPGSDYKLCTRCEDFYYLSSDGTQCVERCNQIGELSINFNERCVKKEQCTKFISSNSKECINECLIGQYYVTSPFKGYSQCTQCPSTSPKSLPDRSYCTSQCPENLISFISSCFSSPQECQDVGYTMSSDGKTCTGTCLSGEFKQLVDEGYNQCLPCPKEAPLSYFDINIGYVCKKKCDKSQFQYYNQNICTDKCNMFTLDMKYCVLSCDPGYFYDSKSKQQQKCTKCPSNLPFSNEVNNTQCSNMCGKDYLIVDNVPKCVHYLSVCQGNLNVLSSTNTCTTSCQIGEFKELLSSLPTKSTYMCKPCPDTLPLSSSDQLLCLDKCPIGEIADSKRCFKNPKECTKIISLDRKYCISECPQNQEIYQEEEYKVCKECPNLYMLSTKSCVESCSSKQVLTPKKQCVSSNQSITECQGLKMSSTKKECSLECKYPDFGNEIGVCIKLCSTNLSSGCTNCKSDYFFDLSGSELKCIKQSDCKYKISLSQQKCVASCEQQDKSMCISCTEGQLLIINSQNKQECKESTSVTILDFKQTILSLMTKPIQSNIIALEMKSQVAFFQKQVVQELNKQASKNVKEILDMKTDLIKQYILSTSDLDTAKDQQIMSINKVIFTSFQKRPSGYQFIKQFNLSNIIKSQNLPMIEKGSDDEDSYNFEIFTIILQNPVCNKNDDECLKFPLFTIDYDNLSTRMLANDQSSPSPFSVIFSVSEISSKYVCLEYNLENIDNKPNWSLPSMSEDGLSVICQNIKSNVSIFLDSDCVFNKKNCQQKDCQDPVNINEKKEDNEPVSEIDKKEDEKPSNEIDKKDDQNQSNEDGKKDDKNTIDNDKKDSEEQVNQIETKDDKTQSNEDAKKDDKNTIDNDDKKDNEKPSNEIDKKDDQNQSNEDVMKDDKNTIDNDDKKDSEKPSNEIDKKDDQKQKDSIDENNSNNDDKKDNKSQSNEDDKKDSEEQVNKIDTKDDKNESNEDVQKDDKNTKETDDKKDEVQENKINKKDDQQGVDDNKKEDSIKDTNIKNEKAIDNNNDQTKGGNVSNKDNSKNGKENEKDKANQISGNNSDNGGQSLEILIIVAISILLFFLIVFIYRRCRKYSKKQQEEDSLLEDYQQASQNGIIVYYDKVIRKYDTSINEANNRSNTDNESQSDSRSSSYCKTSINN